MQVNWSNIHGYINAIYQKLDFKATSLHGFETDLYLLVMYQQLFAIN